MNTLLFLHGWATDGNVWQKQRDFFSNDYKVITPNLHGDSMLQIDKPLYDMVKDEDSLVVIGWSLGWLVALKLLEHVDLKIKGLVSVCGTPKLISSDYIKDGLKISDLVVLRRSLKENFIATLDKFFTMNRVNYTASNALPRKDLYLKQLDILEKTDLRGSLKFIQAPALFIAGEKDVLCPPYVAQYMQSNVPGSTLTVIKNGGHTPFMEDSNNFNLLLADFLAKL